MRVAMGQPKVSAAPLSSCTFPVAVCEGVRAYADSVEQRQVQIRQRSMFGELYKTGPPAIGFPPATMIGRFV